jgi:hypothetical protein
MWLHVLLTAIGHRKQGRMRPTRVRPEALGLKKPNKWKFLSGAGFCTIVTYRFWALEQDVSLLSMSPAGKFSLNMQVHWLIYILFSIRSLYF